MGDVIYALPTVWALGGGHVMLWLGRRMKRRQRHHPGDGMNLSPATAEALLPLLKAQPYVTDASIWRDGEPFDIDLDRFRGIRARRHDHLAERHLRSQWARRWSAGLIVFARVGSCRGPGVADAVGR